MAQTAMPLLMCSLGCEMIYILHQRLHAQQAEAQRLRIVHEIAASFLAPDFCDAVFVPQAVGSVATVYRVFGELAHSSIVRLSSARCAMALPRPNLYARARGATCLCQVHFWTSWRCAARW